METFTIPAGKLLSTTWLQRFYDCRRNVYASTKKGKELNEVEEKWKIVRGRKTNRAVCWLGSLEWSTWFITLNRPWNCCRIFLHTNSFCYLSCVAFSGNFLSIFCTTVSSIGQSGRILFNICVLFTVLGKVCFFPVILYARVDSSDGIF